MKWPWKRARSVAPYDVVAAAEGVVAAHEGRSCAGTYRLLLSDITPTSSTAVFDFGGDYFNIMDNASSST